MINSSKNSDHEIDINNNSDSNNGHNNNENKEGSKSDNNFNIDINKSNNRIYKLRNQEIKVNNSLDSFTCPVPISDSVDLEKNKRNSGDSNNGVSNIKTSLFVTARNLSSTVGKGEKEKKILTDLNFFLKPGSMVLLLGSPGCGKTSLMNTLALLKNNEDISGNLLFNGRPGNEKTHHRHVSYVIQEDQHMAALTVKDTLKFSADCQLGDKTQQERNERVQNVLEFLELSHVKDTVVGDEFLRGVSGGQKKRVTIGVELVKDSNLLLMDEPTNGLDSSIAFDLMTKIKQKVESEKLSCLVSLLQPGVEITRLFDYLMIMNQGQMSYFGPMNQAIGYFESLGFKFPHRHNPAEFFQEIVDEPELYWSGEDHPPYKGAEDFASAYRKSDIYKYTLDYIDNNIPNPSSYVDYSTESAYSITFTRQLLLNIQRGVKLNFGNLVSLRLRILKNVIMGFILGTLYWKLETNQTDGNNRSSLLFFALLSFVFGGFSSISIFFINRPIFYQQRAWKYYNTFSYFVSMVINDLPLSIIEVLVFSNFLYWMTGLNKTWDRFIYFLLMCFVNDVLSQSMLRMVSSFSPNKNIAAALGPALISPFLLMCGFMKKKNDIPGWWIWLYWISPIHYGFEGLLINEHHGLDYHCSENEFYPPSYLPNFNLTYPLGFEGNQVCPIRKGDQILENLGFESEFYFRWVDLAICSGFVILFWIITFFCMKYIQFYEYRKDTSVKVKDQRVAREMRVNIKSSQARLKKTNNVPNGCYMQWKDLVYEVDGKKDGKKQRLRLLNEINGYVKPGMLLALMGPSGAGKSTLLDVLANRKTGGHTKGEILINGQKRDKYFTRISAYVEQMDILSPTQTVREAIMFSAQTRLSKTIPLKDKEDFVENILETLNLAKIQNSLIGEGESGLSLAQRKRVNMGVELASDPQLLFLDEPTSGLDSSSALKVMNFIKKIASSGRAVICTIHQPSTTIFKKFDHLLLLKRGGETVYFGPTGENSSIVLDYFSSHGLECDPFKNPADFVLEVTDDSIQVENEKGELVHFNPVQSFKDSEANKELVNKVQTSIMPEETVVPTFHGKYSSSAWTQFKELNQRAWRSSIRRVEIIRSRIGRSIVLSIIIGTLFLRMDNEQENVYNRVSLLFFSLMFGGMAGMSVIPVVVTERAVFYREQASGMYRVWLYYINLIISDLPWVILTSYAYVIPVYFLTGLTLDDNGWPFFYHSFVSVFVYLNFSLAAIFLASVLPSEEIAFVFNGVLLSLTSLFAGFMVPPKSLPRYWKWVYDIDFITYPLKAYLTTEFKDMEFVCTDGKGAVPIPIPSQNTTKLFCPVTRGTQVLDSVDYKVKDQYYDILITSAFTIFFIVLGFLSFKFVRYQNR
ncbi:hypothetical protein DICPUDRAFT_155800 [Dictyostelium purpureum]|uniref:ABC transporter domain-containing protein n=1 Tax=Dictyostelium purpureum TaxID=5786 RepID=F0ZUX3_DICPU|nr:uncharacterized protein DICPUDRAFT_155800 [Dictyostelium purpureum]EGC32253.1 hypothetical protein DICPUDRAFT_155800 [Dictyostelium purpureum]|eukprot:XP_003291220.1 hypothetical protein DICPUDRAFT_155800 [Dictyostelium purpureum]